MPEETAVANPVAEAPATPSTEAVLGDDSNNFTSDQIAQAIETMKAKKSEATPVAPEAPKVESTLKVETPAVAEVKPEVVPEVKAVEPPKVEDFSLKVAEQVEAKLKEFGIKKPEEVAMDKFYGYKTQEEFQADYEKDPVGVFGKVVGAKVKEEMAAFKSELTQSLNPIKADLENRTVQTHLQEARGQVKELADKPFADSVGKFLSDKSNQALVDNIIAKGKNPYLEVAKIVRAENLANYEKSAYDRGVKETEARLAKAGRAVVEGSGKVVVENESIDLETATSEQILAHLKRSGKA